MREAAHDASSGSAPYRPAALVLGVDAGNTKTIALVAGTDGVIRGTGRGGCGDIYGARSAAEALASVEEAVSTALAAAQAPASSLAAGTFNMAGADWPEDFAFLGGEMRRRGYGQTIHIVNDAIGALRAGSPDNTGVVVVCGTGTAIGARAADGRLWHSSFWQEPQGARQLGERTLRAVYRAALGIDPPTTLTARVLAHFNQPAVEDVLHLLTVRLGAHPPSAQVAALARALLDEAQCGDATARAIVRHHGAMLGDYALAAARQVGLEDRAFPLVLMGGVLRHPSPLLAEAIAARVHAVFPLARPTESRFEPAIGALLLALETAGVTVDHAVLRGIEASLPPPTVFST